MNPMLNWRALDYYLIQIIIYDEMALDRLYVGKYGRNKRHNILLEISGRFNGPLRYGRYVHIIIVLNHIENSCRVNKNLTMRRRMGRKFSIQTPTADIYIACLRRQV